MSAIRLLALIGCISVFQTTVSTQQCYFPDGSTSPDVPCNASASVSSCCQGTSQCLDNGLCFGLGHLSRRSCTSKDWGEGCPPYCQSSHPSGGMPISPCDRFGTNYVCDVVNVTANCAGTDTFGIEGGSSFILRDAVNANGQTSAIAIAPTTVLTLAGDETNGTASSIESASAQTSPAASSAHFTAADVAGAAIGVGAPLLLALLGAIFIIFSQRKKLRQAGAKSKDGYFPAATHDYGQPPASPPKYPCPIKKSPDPYHSAVPQQVTPHSRPQHGVFREMTSPVEAHAEGLVEASAEGERQELEGRSAFPV